MKKTSEPKDGEQERTKARRSALNILQKVIESDTATDAQKVAASRATLLATRVRHRVKKNAKPSDSISGADITRMRERVREEYRGLSERRGDDHFRRDFAWQCERSLYFFAKYCGRDGEACVAQDLTPKLHKGVAEWLQTWPAPGATTERIKLLMMPTQHLKTSMASHGLPLHMVIQPQSANIYFPGELGRNTRIAMIGESADKAEENLSVVAAQLEENVWIRGCWPDCVWPDTSQAKNWSRKFVSVPRTAIHGEPTFTALGVGTKLYQRHYDAIIGDDLIGWDAAGSPTLMKDINEWRKGLLTRRHSPLTSIILYIGTHFTPNDIYVSMKSELPKDAVISRSVVENGEPIWPERFPMTIVEQYKRDMGARLFAHLLMNLPTSEGFTGFDWNFVRLFEFEFGEAKLGGAIVFNEEEVDDEIRAIYADPIAKIVSRWRPGQPLSALYPSGSGRPIVDPYDEKNREAFAKMPFDQQTAMKSLHYLGGKYGEHGEETEFQRNTQGGEQRTPRSVPGFDSIEFRGPTTKIVPRPV